MKPLSHSTAKPSHYKEAEAHLIRLYRQHFDLQDADFSRIEHDEAMVAIVYRVRTDNQQLILKICPRPKDYLREVYFLKLLADQLPVPRLIKTIGPSSDVHGAILMEYLHGTLLTNPTFTETLAYEIGSMLAKIHLNRMSGYGDPVQEEGLNADPRIYFTAKFEEGLEECRGHLPLDLIEKCHHYFEKHVDLLNFVDGPCVVHRDFRPGNLIVDHDKLIGIIDWAGARLSFAEEDFCSMEHEWPTAIKQDFLSGYEIVRPLPNYKNLMPFLRLNKTIATIGFTVKCGTWNNTCKTLYQKNRHFLDTFNFNL